MALGIIKPGQGYWIRVMTASLIGIATIAAAAFAWNQGGLVADKLPKNTWALGIRNLHGAPTPGTTVNLIGPAASGNATPVIGTARIESYSADQQIVKINAIAMSGTRDVGESLSLTSTESPTPALTGSLVKPMTALPAVEPLYIQGSLAAVVLLVGSGLAYWLAGVRPKTVEFLINTDFEMKKVNWSTPREIWGSTIVVIAACAIISGSLFVFDLSFQQFFKTIGVLGR